MVGTADTGVRRVLAVLPLAGSSPYTITLTTDAMVFAIWSTSLDLLVGYTGQ
jgi:ABC-type branched-subunit amino acid transport system permease subunit